MPPGHNLQPLPWRVWGAYHPQRRNIQNFQLRWKNWYLKILIGVFWEMVGVRGGLVALQSVSTSLLKRALPLSISNWMSLFWSFYDNFFHKKHYMPPGHTLQPLPWGVWGFFILKIIISWNVNYVEENAYLKILIGCVWGNGGRENGVSCSSITFDY
jgi:hypothetical protein